MGAAACADGSPFANASSTFVPPDAQPANSLNTTKNTPIKSLSINSGTHACALSDGGALKCWGVNDSGQLGLGDTVNRGADPAQTGKGLPLVYTGLTSVAAVAAGTGSTCALGGGGEVKCWGNNGSGQLGVGDTINHGSHPGDVGEAIQLVSLGTGRRATQLAPGLNHVCALLDNGAVRCWGNNEAGQLGIGDTATRGDQPQEMGDALPVVNLGTGRKAVSVGSGAEYSCALLDNAQVKCWGDNNAGQLGVGDANNRGGNPTDMGDSLPAVNLGTDASVASLSVGQSHSCALLNTGQLKCWGDNSFCMLGLSDQTNRGVDGNQMGDALPTVQLGTKRLVTQVSSGWGGSCAVLDTGDLKCWGYNYYGDLGLGDTLNRGCTAGDMGDYLPTVKLGTDAGAVQQVSMAGVYTCALLQGGVKCWGYNNEGNLGLGDTVSRGGGTQSTGDNLPWVSLFP